MGGAPGAPPAAVGRPSSSLVSQHEPQPRNNAASINGRDRFTILGDDSTRGRSTDAVFETSSSAFKVGPGPTQVHARLMSEMNWSTTVPSDEDPAVITQMEKMIISDTLSAKEHDAALKQLFTDSVDSQFIAPLSLVARTIRHNTMLTLAHRHAIPPVYPTLSYALLSRIRRLLQSPPSTRMTLPQPS